MKTAAPKITTTRLKAGMTGWLFISIAVIMIAAFYFYPMIQALILSFKTGTGSNLSFNGID
ncbi:sugar ABC transporter permease, partial [Bacillus cereus]|nr:sugar ABC transporter permease [Bacillus cereus]